MKILYVTLFWLHAGVLCNGPQSHYVDGEITYEDNVDPNKLFIIELQHIVREMGYTSVQSVFYKAESDTVFVNVDSDKILQDVCNWLKYVIRCTCMWFTILTNLKL